jgi:histidyl-tRNA synthetase
MSKISSVSGFPEWLPEQRIAEQWVIDQVREKFELFGFAPIETRVVEPLDQLLKQGETDKEIYVVRRLHASEDEDNTGLGLHYDLTVPFARYVSQYRGQLQFPLRRYQIQKAWRGERPQEGRYREFTQADIDVVAEGELPIAADAEMPMLLYEVLTSLPIPPVKLFVNNRKILDGAYRAIDVVDVTGVIRIVDKLAKLGSSGVGQLLVEQGGLSPAQADLCLKLAEIRTADSSFADRVRALGLSDPVLDKGLHELTFVMDALHEGTKDFAVADLSIARGFDYYTGSVYEGVMVGHEALGAVCSGGRYDNLVSVRGKPLPGVGVSIGISRIIGRLFKRELLVSSRKSPACVLVVIQSDDQRRAAFATARTLRARGIATETYLEPTKLGKQIRYADQKGIPFVWFLGTSPDGDDQVRDIRSGDQFSADPERWLPPSEDLKPHVSLRST